LHLGYTLFELLVTLAVMSVLVAAAVQGMDAIGRSVKLSSFSNVFVSQLYLARSEAIKRNSRVVMCKSAEGVACAANGGWEQGWLVFHDRNNNGLRDAGEAIIHRVEPLPAGYRFSGNMNVARYISFSPTGGTRLISGAFQAGTLTLCRRSVELSEARQVVINAVGRPRIRRATLPDCA
jgi:type IV fimbrial biogenesis protein FimT